MGQGSFGKVFLASLNEAPVAVKILVRCRRAPHAPPTAVLPVCLCAGGVNGPAAVCMKQTGSSIHPALPSLAC